MARSRNIKPGFLKNEDLGALPPLSRLLFVGLWMIADREGRLEDRPKRIKADCLPYDDCDPNELLWLLHDKGFIVRYKVGVKFYIAIPTFLQHQHPHRNELESIIPDVSAGCITSRLGTKDSGARTDQGAYDSGLSSESLNPREPPPTPPAGGPALVPDPQRTNKPRPPKRSIAQIEQALGTSRMGWWKDFWAIYPCREDKRGAMDAFERVVTSLEVWAKVRAGAIRYRAKAEANSELALKYGQGWINGERWEDEGEATRARASPSASMPDKAAQTMAVLKRNLAAENKL